jgi:hypothetical protein
MMAEFIRNNLDRLIKKEKIDNDKKIKELRRQAIGEFNKFPYTNLYERATEKLSSSSKYKDRCIKEIIKRGLIQMSRGEKVFKRNDLSYDNMCDLEDDLKYMSSFTVYTKKEITLYIKTDNEVEYWINNLLCDYPELNRETILQEINKILITSSMTLLRGSLRLKFRLLEYYKN